MGSIGLSILLSTVLISRSAFSADLIAIPDITIKYINSDKTEKLSSGKTLKTEITEPLWITSHGRVPVLVIPQKSGSTQIKIDPPALTLPQAPQCESNSIEKTSNKEASNLIVGIFEIQKLISLNKKIEARTILNKLKQTNPQVTALDFLEASLDVLDGKKTEAKVKLKRAITNNPEYEDGLKLLNTLEGKNK